ncbi:MAG: hypothetical protein Q8M92_10005, partial [Candidatus Subteraquimicrobiales bacterium]|nr:hypothetical protein [Candidatus Subteraquimicrobiales bacterium]
MTKKSSIFFLISTLLFVFVFSSQAMAVTMPGAIDCGLCHAKFPSDFESYLELSLINLDNCRPCHAGIYSGHGNAFFLTPYGYFYSAESLNFDNATTVASIHTAHRRTEQADSGWCDECHVGASCATCHSSPVQHRAHSILSDGTNPYPGIAELYGGGRGNYLVYSATFTCTNEKCHSSMNLSFAARPSCLNCHTVDKTGHGDVSISAAHTYAALYPGCMGPGCHVNELTGEHKIRTSEAGNPLTCQTCHTSTDSAVQNAITTKNVACEACHVVVGHRALHEAEPPATGCLGEGCHQNNLCGEHESRTDPATDRPYDCSVCHGPTAPQYAKDAIANYEEK